MSEQMAIEEYINTANISFTTIVDLFYSLNELTWITVTGLRD